MSTDAAGALRILHVDMDAFFASVEQRDRPELRGKPVIVGAGPHVRGVVSTCSYEARKFGVHSAMPSREAFRLCPQGVFVPPDMDRYMEASAKVFAIFDRYTPLVQGLSCDEAFLDVSGASLLFGDPVEIARRIRADIASELSLTASVGVAPNKFLAKLASDLHKPDGLTIVPTDPEDIRAFLAPLPATRIFGVGKVLGETLRAHGVKTIGDIQKTHPSALARWCGPTAAEALHELAFGRDGRTVETEREEKSISREHTFSVDEKDPAAVRALLLDLASDVARQVRAAGKFAATAHLKLRTDDFRTVTRQRPFDRPACDDFAYRDAASALLAA
ncbi:MAG: DNA polymerase IV, partial [Kiritimatiellae bacterium]|nr:DNA polymerase IV [Kiritimatiellia bacterium]